MSWVKWKAISPMWVIVSNHNTILHIEYACVTIGKYWHISLIWTFINIHREEKLRKVRNKDWPQLTIHSTILEDRYKRLVKTDKILSFFYIFRYCQIESIVAHWRGLWIGGYRLSIHWEKISFSSGLSCLALGTRGELVGCRK